MCEYIEVQRHQRLLTILADYLTRDNENTNHAP
jgi:hypothetical protein